MFNLVFSRCTHCQQLSPELDAAADQLATKNQFVFAKVRCVLLFALAFQTVMWVGLSRTRFWRCVTQLPRQRGCAIVGCLANRLSPSCILPLCQSKSKCETIHMKMSPAYKFIFTEIKLILIWRLCMKTCFETDTEVNSAITRVAVVGCHWKLRVADLPTLTVTVQQLTVQQRIL